MKRINFQKIWTEHVYLIVLLFMSLTVSILYYVGYYASDDLSSSYIPNVYRIINGIPLTEIIRLPIIFFIFLGKWVFGFEGIPMLFSFFYQLIIILTYVLANMIFGKGAGRIAATLAFGVSIFYYYAGAILPDNLLTAAVLLAYICVIKSFTSKTTREKYFWAVITGLFSTIVFLMKEPYIIILVGFIPFGLHYKDKIVESLKIASVVLVSFVGFFAINKLILFGFGTEFTLFSFEVESQLQYFIEGNIRRGSETLPKHIVYTLKNLMFNWSYHYIVLMIAIVAATVLGIWKKNKLMMGLTLGYFVMLTYYACASVSLEQFVGLPVQNRYFAPLHGISVVIIAGLLIYIIRNRESLYPTVILALLILSCVQVYGNLPKAGDIYNSVKQRAFQEVVIEFYNNRDTQQLLVYNDPKTNRLTNYYNYVDMNIDFQTFDVEEKMIFDENTVFIYQQENYEMSNYLMKYAEENGLFYVEHSKSYPRTRRALMPLLSNYQKKYIRDIGFVYGSFENISEYSVILDVDFETWENGLPIYFRKRNQSDDEVSVHESDDDTSARIESNGDINYIYYKYIVPDELEYNNIKFLVETMISGNVVGNITFKIEYDNAEQDTVMRYSVSNTEWEEVGGNYHFEPGCNSITVMFAVSGDGDLFIDNFVLSAR